MTRYDFPTVGDANNFARTLYERKIRAWVRQDESGYFVMVEGDRR